MRQMMACPEPMISIGGSDATLATLPRLGWARLPDVQKYALPVRARGLAGTLLRSRWPAGETYARAIPGFVPLRRPRRAETPSGVGRVVEWLPGMCGILPAPPDEGLVALLEQADQDWIARMPPGVAQPLGLAFFLDDRPVGFSLSQIEPAVAGLDGCIVHLQIAHAAQAEVDWVVAETACQLAARGVGMIRCLASSPGKMLALRKAGFVATGSLPSYWWPKAGIPIPSATDAGYLRADDALPFPALQARHLAASHPVSRA
jgi:hypothetical protein